ncbi:hypothetical protein SISSUDRAFT_994379 [Sistotremastrum suecicum HHB10207 ss-3]|uniref:IMD domain-containing protein n=1 Tax=Sistotremastrum suecicum HHB10207 ss-3 TaxID=1314776 RepID=A0A165XEY7_9AGAM|nr:hypothetical protein SISSUDRAFT_994379 [Sistotremastrum suecicum HHB10207 ss-3]
MSNIRPPSFSKINRPTSPTLSEATTRASMLDLDGKVITRADLRASVQAYETVPSASYRAALISLSNSTAAFADAIETCSGLKGASFATASRQGAAAGFHHLFANHLHLLSTSIDRKFEKPLAQHLNDYRHVIVERSAAYEKSLRDRSRIIRQTEAENMNIGRRRERNMETFRAALAVLQSQVDEIDRLKVEHYQEIAEHEEETWDFVQGKARVAVVVKSTFEVFDRLSSKSTDPILEPMLSSIPDPFDSYGPPKPEGQIFSVLQPLGIMTDPSQPSTPRTSEPDTSIAAPRPSWVNDMGGFLPSNTSTYAEWQNVQSSDYSQRRHSFPASLSTTSESPLSSPPKSPPQRVAESKLRNVLSAIDENRGLNESEPAPDLSTSPSSSELNAQG